MIFAAGLAFLASSGCSTANLPGIETFPAGAVPQASATLTAKTQLSKYLAPGLEYSRADQAADSSKIKWFLSLGVIRNPAEASKAADCAKPLQLQPQLEKFIFPGEAPVPYTEMTLGAFSTYAEAQSYLDSHPLAAHCMLAIKASPLYPTDDSAPAIIHILRLDPSKFGGKLVASRKDDGAYGRTRPSEILRQKNALAATNGGFFVMESADGVVGESTGISIIAGALQSEPSKGRPWLLIENNGKIRTTLHDREPDFLPNLRTPDGRHIMLDGINRKPGLLRNCGALLDPDFSVSIHDVTCNPLNEIIALTPQPHGPKDKGAKLSEGWNEGPDGELAAYRFRQNQPLIEMAHGQSAGPDEILLMASGNRKSELAALAASRQPIRLDLGHFSADKQAYALNGGPMLLAKGRIVAKENVQGWPFAESSLKQANAMHRFINLRAPRTALGITKSGEILIVVVDGWRYRTNTAPPIPMNGGMNIAELADLMRRLGAEDAINFDGGGSSVMALKNGIISHPSDSDGERAVGDSLLILP